MPGARTGAPETQGKRVILESGGRGAGCRRREAQSLPTPPLMASVGEELGKGLSSALPLCFFVVTAFVISLALSIFRGQASAGGKWEA